MSTATVCHHATGSSSLFVRRRPCAADSRYDNGYEAARQKIWSGDYGALKTIVMHSTSSLFNGSSHCLDVANILNNDSPVRWVQVILPTAPGVSNEGGEFSPLGSLAGCFLALGAGLGLVGTVSSRR